MHAILGRTTVPMLLVLLFGALSFAGEPPTPQASSVPSIEGTYRFVSRKFRDGTTLKPPEVMGFWTYTKTHRNFHVVWKDATGKFSSYSVIATYKLTPTEYSETLLFCIVNEQICGKDISPPTMSPRPTVEGGRVRFILPFEPRMVVIEGNKMTTFAEGDRNVDTWEKVE